MSEATDGRTAAGGVKALNAARSVPRERRASFVSGGGCVRLLLLPDIVLCPDRFVRELP